MRISRDPTGIDRWAGRVRAAFWLLGIVLGGVFTYNTRHFVNSDAIMYIEMAEMLLRGELWGLVNFTFSPLYPMLLSVFQLLLRPGPENEVPVLKIANFAVLLASMGGCDLIVSLLAKRWSELGGEGESPLPFGAASALCYAMFLVAALVCIRLQVMNPDLMVLFIVTVCCALVLLIREQPQRYSYYVALGVAAGFGFLTKAFFILYSPLLFALAACVSGSFRRALHGTLAAIFVAVVVMSPLVGALSYKKGSFSYGEGGRFVYASEVAGKGEPIHFPNVLNERPRVSEYNLGLPCTASRPFDVCYWHIGVEPNYRVTDHARRIAGNVLLVFEQTPWLAMIIAWALFMWWNGSIRLGSVRPLSPTLMFMSAGVFGMALFCLIRVEPRYVAPFSFLFFVGLVTAVRYPLDDAKAQRRAVYASLVLMASLLVLLAESTVDQTLRSLWSNHTKLSHRDAYLEQVAVKDFLKSYGIKPSEKAAVLGQPQVHWARMAGLRVTGYIDKPEEFFHATAKERKRAIDALRKAGFKVLVAHGRTFAQFASEGWRLVPGTRSYYAILLEDRSHRAGKFARPSQ